MSQPDIFPTTLAGFPALAAAPTPGHPPLLFVHGVFATHEPFSKWLACLAGRGWGGFAVGRRNQIGAPLDNLRIADYVADTLQAIDALGEAPVIVGHSLGGLIAQKIAELGRCRGAVLIAPAPPYVLSTQPAAIPAALPMIPRILLGWPTRPSRWTAESLALNRVPPADRARIYDGFVRDSGRVYREMIFGSFRIDASKVRCPVLVTGGDSDRVVSVSQMRDTAARCRAAVRIYPGHGHWLLEEPGYEAIAGEVADWLDATFAAAEEPGTLTA